MTPQNDTRMVMESIYNRVMTLQIVVESLMDELYEKKIINPKNVDNRIKEKTKELNEIVEKLSEALNQVKAKEENKDDSIDISSLFNFGKSTRGEA